MLLASRPYRDFNILAECCQKIHKALNREGARLSTHQPGDMGLLDTQNSTCFRLGKTAVFDDPVDLESESGLELLPLRIGKSEVRKDVATTLSNANPLVLLHLSILPFSVILFRCGEALAEKVDFPPRCGNTLLGLLLKGVQYINRVMESDGIHRRVGVAVMWSNDLKHRAPAEPLHGSREGLEVSPR